MLFGRIFINVETILGSIWHRFPWFFKHIFADGFCIDFLLIVHRFMNRCTLKKHCSSRVKSRVSWNRDAKTNLNKYTDFTLNFRIILHVFSINLPYLFGIDLMMSFWTSFLWIWIAKRLRCGRQCGLLEAQSAHVHPKLVKNRVQKGFLGGSKINTSLQKVFWGSPGLVLAQLWHAYGRMLPPLMHIFFHIWNFWLSWLRILMKNWTLTSTQSHLEETSISSAIFSRHGAEYLPLATKINTSVDLSIKLTDWMWNRSDSGSVGCFVN